MVLQHPKFIMSSDRDSENEQGTKCRIYNNKIHLVISDFSLDALTEVNNPDPFDDKQNFVRSLRLRQRLGF